MAFGIYLDLKTYDDTFSTAYQQSLFVNYNHRELSDILLNFLQQLYPDMQIYYEQTYSLSHSDIPLFQSYLQKLQASIEPSPQKESFLSTDINTIHALIQKINLVPQVELLITLL